VFYSGTDSNRGIGGILGESLLSYELLQLNRPINVGFRQISAHVLKEKVPLRPISFLPALHAKELAERGKIGSTQARKLLQFRAFGWVPGAVASLDFHGQEFA
jgi:hypothetical protein